MVAECRQDICGAQIDWATTTTGSHMPVDRESAGRSDGANLAVWRGSGKRLICKVLKKGEIPEPGQKWGTSHWGTCTAAEGWMLNRKNHRWELRAKPGQDPVTWLHVARVAELVDQLGWDGFAAQQLGAYGVPLPPVMALLPDAVED